MSNFKFNFPTDEIRSDLHNQLNIEVIRAGIGDKVTVQNLI